MTLKFTRPRSGISKERAKELPIFRSNRLLIVSESHQPELVRLSNSIRSCRLCSLGCDKRLINRPVIRGTVPCNVLYIGEAPSVHDHSGNQPLIGVVGDTLEEIHNALAPMFKQATAAFITTVQCLPFPPENVKDKDHRAPNKSESRTCFDAHTQHLINLCNPDVVVLVGEVAKTTVRQSPDREYVHIRHPSSMFRQKDLALEKATAFTAIRDAMERKGLVF